MTGLNVHMKQSAAGSSARFNGKTFVRSPGGAGGSSNQSFPLLIGLVCLLNVLRQRIGIRQGVDKLFKCHNEDLLEKNGGLLRRAGAAALAGYG